MPMANRGPWTRLIMKWIFVIIIFILLLVWEFSTYVVQLLWPVIVVKAVTEACKASSSSDASISQKMSAAQCVNGRSKPLTKTQKKKARKRRNLQRKQQQQQQVKQADGVNVSIIVCQLLSLLMAVPCHCCLFCCSLIWSWIDQLWRQTESWISSQPVGSGTGTAASAASTLPAQKQSPSGVVAKNNCRCTTAVHSPMSLPAAATHCRAPTTDLSITHAVAAAENEDSSAQLSVSSLSPTSDRSVSVQSCAANTFHSGDATQAISNESPAGKTKSPKDTFQPSNAPEKGFRVADTSTEMPPAVTETCKASSNSDASISHTMTAKKRFNGRSKPLTAQKKKARKLRNLQRKQQQLQQVKQADGVNVSISDVGIETVVENNGTKVSGDGAKRKEKSYEKRSSNLNQVEELKAGKCEAQLTTVSFLL
jgi:hypothetical protein